MKIMAELARHVWAMEQRALEAFMAKVGAIEDAVLSRGNKMVQAAVSDISQESPEANMAPLAFLFESEPVRKSRVSVENGTATIPISGVLMKSVPRIFRYFGVDATSYQDLQADLAQAVGDESVSQIRLVVDSPGGQVAGVKEAADAIAMARAAKPVTAQVDDLAASAAYWLAAQAGRITASPNAQVGSIGVYSAYVDSSKAAEIEGVKVHLVASGPHKGMGLPGTPITEDQLAAVREVVNGMAANFVSDVSRGRGKSRETVEQWASGRTWLAQEAARLGLIDEVSSGEKGAAGVRPAAASVKVGKEEHMSKEEQEAATVRASQEAVAAERKRIGDIKAAFQDDPSYALAAIEKGQSVMEAKAEYADVLKGRLKESEDRTKAVKAAVAVAGVEPVGSEIDPANVAGGDFITRSKALAQEKGIPVHKAMSIVAKTEPALYEKHIDSCKAAAPAHAANKRRLGVQK